MIEFYHSALHICIGYNPRIKTRGWQIFSQMVRKVSNLDWLEDRIVKIWIRLAIRLKTVLDQELVTDVEA